MANQPTKYRKFVVGAASAALVASAVAPVASAADFKDTKGNTHEPAIDALSDAGIITGYPDGTFLPNKTLTRSDVVKLMGKWLVSEGYAVPSDYKTNPRFTDLKSTSNDELLQYAAVVKDNGVFVGTPDGKLDAAGNITRENMAIVLVRAFDRVNDIDLATYVAGQDFKKDVVDLGSAKAEARPAIDVLDFFDITNPAAPTFNPKSTTTRGQFATFLHKTLNTDFSDVKSGVVAPGVASVKAVNATTVEVAFKDKVDNINSLNFSIDGLTVSNAAVKQTDDKVVVLTTAVQKGGEKYTVSLNEKAIGSFEGISAVIPSTIKLNTRSVQGIVGQQAILSADIGVKEAGVPVTFNVKAANTTLNKDQVFEVVTNADGIATFSYTQYAEGNDTVTVYPTGKADLRESGTVYWAKEALLTVKDITEATTLANGSKKVYEINSERNKNKYVFVTFKENLNVTPDKLVKTVNAEGVTTYELNTSGVPTTALARTAYPYKATVNGEAVIAVKLDNNGKANLVLTGSNGTVTPIVYEGKQLNTVTNPTQADYNAKYDATALQATANTVIFTVQHALGLTIKAEGVQNAAIASSTGTSIGTGGRDYVINYTDKDGKSAEKGTTVRVAIPKTGLKNKNGNDFVLRNHKGDVITSYSQDNDYLYYNVPLEKAGQATFTVTSTEANDYVAPIVFIENGTVNGLDKDDLQATGEVTYFVSKVDYAAKLKVLDTDREIRDVSKEVKSLVADGTTPAWFVYQLVDQNGKLRTANEATRVTFSVQAGPGRISVAGQTFQAGQNDVVTVNIPAGQNYVSIPVIGLEPSSATITATGSLAGIVLNTTQPASQSVTFTQYSTADVTGDVVATSVNKTNNTFALIDSASKVHVYNYEDATLLQNNASVSEQTFETLLEAGARLTVSKDANGKLTFNVVAPSGSATFNAQQNVDFLIQQAVLNNDASVTVPATGGGNITVNTDAAINIVVNVDSVNNLTITGANTQNVNINKSATGLGNISGDLTVNTPKAHVTLGTGVAVAGHTDIQDVLSSSFTNNGILNTVEISDTNGARFVNNSLVTGVVKVSGKGSVVITGSGTPISEVVVTGAANVTIPSGAAVTKVTVENENATVENKNGGSTVVDNEYQVKPVTELRFKDTNSGSAIDGEITFTTTDAIDSGATKFDINVNGATVATVDKNTTGTTITYSFTAGSIKAGDKVTVIAKNADKKASTPVEVTVVNNTTVSETFASAINVANPYLTGFVKGDNKAKDGKIEVPTTAAAIEVALKARLVELQALTSEDADAAGRNLAVLKNLKAEDIKVNGGNIAFSNDDKTISINGPVLSEAAFIVAKGAKENSYAEPFNITLIKAAYADTTTGSIADGDKLAKIQIDRFGKATISSN
ncbi:S-layer homology domain-containing protein [Sporosarcina sp. 179-K 3D1 HS]|uniref:S-layer homology domain-containing protein n=1 Tax=Sporosarcina sp. 179-K 3D1 HS TaxID=3232169 RepID=UPI0039A38D59